jgi:hypothetical protein
MIYACRALARWLRGLAINTNLTPHKVAVIPTAALAVLNHRHPAVTWLGFLAYSAAFSAAYLGLCVLLLRREWRAVRIVQHTWAAPGLPE